MTLIKSISGIRGTIGGQVGTNLTPIDAVKFAAAYGTWLKQQRNKEDYRVVVCSQDILGRIILGVFVHVDTDISKNIGFDVPHVNEENKNEYKFSRKENMCNWRLWLPWKFYFRKTCGTRM